MPRKNLVLFVERRPNGEAGAPPPSRNSKPGGGGPGGRPPALKNLALAPCAELPVTGNSTARGSVAAYRMPGGTLLWKRRLSELAQLLYASFNRLAALAAARHARRFCHLRQ